MDNNEPISPTLEQQFAFAAAVSELDSKSDQQIVDELVAVYTKMLLQEAHYKKAIKQEWGLESSEEA